MSDDTRDLEFELQQGRFLLACKDLAAKLNQAKPGLGDEFIDEVYLEKTERFSVHRWHVDLYRERDYVNLDFALDWYNTLRGWNYWNELNDRYGEIEGRCS